jgi:hypothetical protein
MAYTLDIGLALGTSKTGLTLQAQLVDTTGVSVGSAVTTGFTEIGGGAYLWHHVAFPDSHRGGVKFSTTGAPATILAFAALNPEEAENVDAKTSTRSTWDALTSALTTVGSVGKLLVTKLGLIGAASVTVTSPVTVSDNIELVRGGDYLNTDGRALSWSGTGWPNLTAAQVALTIGGLTVNGTVVASTPTTPQVIRFELTAAQTGAFRVGLYEFGIQAILANASVIPLLRGTVDVAREP